MIYLCLKGRLGNQLYQLGAALRLARFDTQLIRIDPRYFQNPEEYRLTEVLDAASLPTFVTEADLASTRRKAKIFSVQDTQQGAFFDQPLLETSIDLHANDVVLDGYFQSGKNMATLREYLYQPRVFKNSPLMSDLSALPEGTVVAHYRMGDYLKPDVQREIGLVNLSYLDSALEKLWDQSQELLLFSDGEEIQKRYQPRAGIRVIYGQSADHTYKAMLGATTLIIPNSTFSLTAAFLSPCIKTLCRPMQWSRRYLDDHLSQGLSAAEVRITNSFYPI